MSLCNAEFLQRDTEISAFLRVFRFDEVRFSEIRLYSIISIETLQ